MCIALLVRLPLGPTRLDLAAALQKLFKGLAPLIITHDTGFDSVHVALAALDTLCDFAKTVARVDQVLLVRLDVCQLNTVAQPGLIASG